MFTDGIDKLVRLVEQKDEMVARIRTHRKQMKADGFMRPEVDYALWMQKHDGQDAADEMAMRIRIAQWMGQPLGYQASLDLAAQ